jgi:sec-independent protein translocase protein TatB
MFNLGGGEILVILLIALIVLGPQKLPEAARKVGQFTGELRRMSSGFQDELRRAMDEPVTPTRPSSPSASGDADGLPAGDAAAPERDPDTP